MNQFAEAIKTVAEETSNIAFTDKGAITLRSSTDEFTDFFAMVGSSRNSPEMAVEHFKRCYQLDPKLALRILFWARDARGGAGERAVLRNCLAWMMANGDRKTLEAIIDAGVIENYGRWDDYIGLMVNATEPVSRKAANHVLAAVKAGNGLSCKWLPRKGKEAAKIRQLFGMSPKMYRRTLVDGTKVVETQMCQKNWDGIVYEHVPSVAMARYTRAFFKNSAVAFPAYKAKLETGEVKAKASVLFPYDVLRTVDHGDAAVADAQWKELPNFIDSDAKLFPIIDVSGSMTAKVSGSVTAMAIAVSLGIYLAERNQSAFKDMFMTFETEPKMVQIPKGTIAQRVREVYDAPWGGSTNLQAAFDLLLETATRFHVPQKDMPEYLFIVSDMEFDQAVGTYAWAQKKTDTNFNEIDRKFREAGYKRPNIIFWNVHSHGAQVQVTSDKNGTAMISGFSPSIIRPVLNAEEISPRLIMEQAVMAPRYDVVGLTV